MTKMTTLDEQKSLVLFDLIVQLAFELLCLKEGIHVLVVLQWLNSCKLPSVADSFLWAIFRVFFHTKKIKNNVFLFTISTAIKHQSRLHLSKHLSNLKNNLNRVFCCFFVSYENLSHFTI